jgi:hypothetical protein
MDSLQPSERSICIKNHVGWTEKRFEHFRENSELHLVKAVAIALIWKAVREDGKYP